MVVAAEYQRRQAQRGDGQCTWVEGGEVIIGCRQRTERRSDGIGADIARTTGYRRKGRRTADRSNAIAVHEAADRRGQRWVGVAEGLVFVVGGDGQMRFGDRQ